MYIAIDAYYTLDSYIYIHDARLVQIYNLIYEGKQNYNYNYTCI